jgi:LPS export ABC transporter protein LptC
LIRRKTRHGIALLTLLALASWLISRAPSEPGDSPVAELDTRMNYVLWDFDAELLDDEGSISMEISSPKLRNNASSAIGTIENPRIRIRHEQDEWYIRAESAIITADREHVSLMGRVDMLRRNSVSNETMEIETRDVILAVTPKTARTESAVKLIQDGDTLQAVGLELNMKKNKYELLDEVQAHYETS